jgi:hypothetical protein
MKELRNELSNAIEIANSTDDVIVGNGFKQLARDLRKTSKPIVLDYAAILGFDARIEAMHDYIQRASKKGAMDEMAFDKAYGVIETLDSLFETALDKGVLITQDTARSRITKG